MALGCEPAFEGTDGSESLRAARALSSIHRLNRDMGGRAPACPGPWRQRLRDARKSRHVDRKRFLGVAVEIEVELVRRQEKGVSLPDGGTAGKEPEAVRGGSPCFIRTGGIGRIHETRILGDDVVLRADMGVLGQIDVRSVEEVFGALDVGGRKGDILGIAECHEVIAGEEVRCEPANIQLYARHSDS